jgi:hypothetical protein
MIFTHGSMGRKGGIFIVSWFALTWLIAGCGRVSGSGMSKGEKPKAVTFVSETKRNVLVGIDVTGSYVLLDQALPLAAEFFFSNAKPGDTWTFRWIEKNSYSDRAVIPVLGTKSSVTLPLLPPKPTNPFDKKAKLTYLLRVQEVMTLKKKVADTLRALRRQPDVETDIWSFFAKAQDLKVTDIVMFTDLEDTMKREIPLKLEGVRVWLLGFQSGKDPKQAAKRRAYWTDVLTKAGVQKVVFHDISQPLPCWEE